MAGAWKLQHSGKFAKQHRNILTFALSNDSYVLKDLWVGVDFILEFSLIRRSRKTAIVFFALCTSCCVMQWLRMFSLCQNFKCDGGRRGQAPEKQLRYTKFKLYSNWMISLILYWMKTFNNHNVHPIVMTRFQLLKKAIGTSPV